MIGHKSEKSHSLFAHIFITSFYVLNEKKKTLFNVCNRKWKDLSESVIRIGFKSLSLKICDYMVALIGLLHKWKCFQINADNLHWTKEKNWEKKWRMKVIFKKTVSLGTATKMANLIESAYTYIDRRWSDCKLSFRFTYQWQTHQTHFGQMCVNLFITRSI